MKGPLKYTYTLNGCYEALDYKSNKRIKPIYSNRRYNGARYIRVTRFKKKFNLHRLVFYVYYGYFPDVVMHSCDNIYCVNPQHLIGGTNKENSQDASKKGRIAFGIRNKGGGNKLNDSKVKKIKMKLSKGQSLMNIAKQFNVSKKMILYIKQGKKWKHIGGEVT